MSIAQWLGIPPNFLDTLLVIALLLTLAAYLEQMTIGSFVVPKLVLGRRRMMRIGGPVALFVLIGLCVPIPALRSARPKLELLAADFTDQGVIDIVLSNSGTAEAVVTRIEIEVVRDHRQMMRPALQASATYRIPIGNLAPGQRRIASIRHIIRPASTERLLIATETARVLDVRIRIISASEGALVSDVRLWHS